MKLDESRHGKPEKIRATAGDGVIGNRPEPGEACDNSTAQIKQPDPCHQLMEEVLERQNLFAALEKVKGNQGCAGIDGMRTEELGEYLKQNWLEIKERLLHGEYEPNPVLRAEIPKKGEGTRNLGIPIVLDRFIQQALLQKLAPIFEPEFSKSSYAYQAGRSAHDAIRAAKQYVAEGYEYVVDLDLEKFFDHVNHDILMNLIAKKVQDKRVLKLIGRFLRAGVMVNGVVQNTPEGTPQGGPLSPLLSNIMLNVLDKELESRGLRFCRYADDCNIYMRSERAANRVMKSVKNFISRKLKLKVNEAKSAVDKVGKRKFLGFTITENAQININKMAMNKCRQKVRILTRRNGGCSMEDVIKRLNLYLRGWIGYFALSDTAKILERMDGWIRRRLRSLWWMLRKTPKKRREALMELGVKEIQARRTSSSGRGPWRISRTPSLHTALNKNYFDKLNLVKLEAMWEVTRLRWKSRRATT